MKTMKLGKTNQPVPQIAIGCMRTDRLSKDEATDFISCALELKANFFDHADIYGSGRCEELFGNIISSSKIARDRLILQSKCGIVPGVKFDFSKAYIIKSVESSLKRLKTDYLDVLLLHRPDALMEPDEVAEAFDKLKSCGKVKHFGVSNHNPTQIELLQKYLNVPIAVNQLQLSIVHSNMISNGINVNMLTDSATCRDDSVLDYCRLNDITIQAWSPFMYGFFEGVFLNNPKFPKLNKTLDEMAEKYYVSDSAIALAWILRHPAKIQPVIGTMNIQHIKDCVKACNVKLTREEWYKIYIDAGNVLP